MAGFVRNITDVLRCDFSIQFAVFGVAHSTFDVDVFNYILACTEHRDEVVIFGHVFLLPLSVLLNFVLFYEKRINSSTSEAILSITSGKISHF